MTEPRERVFVAAPQSTGRGTIVTPFQFEFTGEDQLEVTYICLAGQVNIAIGLRMLTADGGEIKAHSFDFNTPVSPEWRTRYYPIGVGFVANAIVHIASGAPARGQCWVRLRVVRGFGANPVPLGTLLQGYITLRSDLAFPGSPLEQTFAGQGALVVRGDGVAPIPSVEYAFTVPPNRRWRLLSFMADLATSAVAGNRQAWLYVQLPFGSEVFRSGQAYAQPPSTAIRYCWAAGMPLETQPHAGVMLAGLMPDLVLPPSTIISTFVPTLDLNDQWSEGRAMVEEWVYGD